MSYNPVEIEKKWQKFWAENQTFRANDESSLPKYYVLDMFPYPSGAGLHVGHPLGYIASDVVARYKRHQGFNVLHPQGYDSFGLPAEQYALQTGQHPAITTKDNIKTYRRQLDRIGFSFDWSREVRTSDPNYYKWTQWIFIQLYNSYYCNKENTAKSITTLIQHFEEKGTSDLDVVRAEKTPEFSASEWNAFDEDRKLTLLLDYRLTYISDTQVNWCNGLKSILANDEIVNGVSERGGFPVVKRKMKQWSMRIGAYAERLLNDLNELDWTVSLKEIQRNWIGKSEGAKVFFEIENCKDKIEVFTTRPDTLFGVTFMVLAPEHELVKEITTETQKQKIQDYIEETSKRSDVERMASVKRVSGENTGAYAIHPLTKERLPIWIADYVLASYGTGAVMAVPCGDQRDYDFAKHFDIRIKNIFEGADISEEAFSEKGNTPMVDSDFLDGLNYQEAMPVVLKALEEKDCGKATINYKLRDVIFSRQRYWGEPIPIYFKGLTPHPIPETKLPLILPEVKDYHPADDGNSPLKKAEQWAWNETTEEVVSTNEVDHKTIFPLETNTMPAWAGSSWYFYRYMDSKNDKELVGKSKANYWQKADLYIGGSEHATSHLLYARFWQKFLYDLDYLPTVEFSQKLINQGMILGLSAFIKRKSGTENEFYSKNSNTSEKTEPIHVNIKYVEHHDKLNIDLLKENEPQFKDAIFHCENNEFIVDRVVEKMSKSKFNVINPDEICDTYGADTLRMYELFLGPLEQVKPWNTEGITGVSSFLNKLWKLYVKDSVFIKDFQPPSADSLKTLHQTIKKITEDINRFSFNTCISSLMICVNELTQQKCQAKEVLEPLVLLVSPFAPHVSEELWSMFGSSESIATVPFPTFDEKYLIESSKDYPVSFNGKLRFKKEYPLDFSIEKIKEEILKEPQTKKYLEGKSIVKIIVVPNKIINLVIK